VRGRLARDKPGHGMTGHGMRARGTKARGSRLMMRLSLQRFSI